MCFIYSLLDRESKSDFDLKSSCKQKLSRKSSPPTKVSFWIILTNRKNKIQESESEEENENENNEPEIQKDDSDQNDEQEAANNMQGVQDTQEGNFHINTDENKIPDILGKFFLNWFLAVDNDKNDDGSKEKKMASATAGSLLSLLLKIRKEHIYFFCLHSCSKFSWQFCICRNFFCQTKKKRPKNADKMQQEKKANDLLVNWFTTHVNFSFQLT